MSLENTIDYVLARLDGKLIGLDQQKKQLKEIIRRWEDTKKGDSCVVTGPRGSGRTQLVDKLLEGVDEKKHFLYIAQLGSDATAQNSIIGDENEPRVIVVADADELVARQRQTLLYSFLESTRNNPWLVILMVNRHDFVSNGLEKRVRSRLSTARIIFTGPQIYDDYYEGFKQFLRYNSKNVDSNWKTFMAEFSTRKEVERELKYMFSQSNSFGVLKTVVAVFLGFLKDSKNPREEAIPLWIDAVATLVPSCSPVAKILSGVSLRTYCVFLCVFRRLENLPPSASVSYRKVSQDYKNLCNTADTRMRVGDDAIIFKELDYLVKLRILFADTQSNNIGYRRISLHADSINLAEGIKKRTIPSAVTEWFKSIPTH